MAVGDGGAAGVVSDARKIYLSVGLSSFLGCAERKILVSNRALVHMVHNVDRSLPHDRDAMDGTTVSAFGVGDVRQGGQLFYEENIVGFGTTLAGLNGAIHQGINDVDGTGAAKLQGNVFAPGIIHTSNIRSANVEALPVGYTYPPTTVSISDPVAAERQIIDGASAGRVNFPEGQYAPIKASDADAAIIAGLPFSAFANEEQLVYDGLANTFWFRIDETAAPINPDLVEAAAFTPTLTAVANCSSPTVARAAYQRVLNRVLVDVVFDITLTTTATSTSIGVSLPIPHDLIVTSDVIGGSRVVSSTNQAGGYVNGDAANDRAQVTITPTSANGSTVRISASFAYMLS
jgi:hypothetical protein